MDKNKSIFITGATGFIGSYIVKYLLKEGYTNLIAIRRKSSPLDLLKDDHGKLEWIIADLMDEFAYQEALAKSDIVIHSAAIVSYDKALRKKMYQINIEGTAQLVNHSLEHQIEKFIHVSSVAAIGRFKRVQSIDENSKWQRSAFNSHYGITKHLAEMEVWRGSAEGLNVGIINPSVVIGGGFWDKGSSSIFPKAWKGLPYYPTGKTGYVDVRDVAKLTIAIMENDQANHRYIANGGNLYYKELFDVMLQTFNKKSPSSPLPNWAGALYWRFDTIKSWLCGKAPIVTKETIAHLKNEYTYSNEKSISQLNYEYLPIEKSIQESAKAFMTSLERKESFSHLPLI
ncbi:MAG: SDR family NAD(P)-dependent oxidoreductase [Bacteroidota bacterium]